MDVAELYKLILDLLPQNSLQKIITAAADYLHQHVTVLDTGYRVLASWPQELIDDPYWDAQQIYGIVPEDNLRRIFVNKYPDSTFSGSTYINWGDVVVPRGVASLTYEGRSLGHVSIYHTDLCLEEKDILAAVDCLSGVLRVFFLSNNLLSSTNEVAMSTMFSHLFSGRAVDAQFRDQWQQFSGFSLSGNFVVISVGHSDMHHSLMDLVSGRLRQIHKFTAFAEMENYCYILFYQISSSKHWRSILARLEDYLKNYRIPCGVSQMFSSLDLLQSFMYQSRRALKLGNRLNPRGMIFTYPDFQYYSMLDYITEHVESINFKHQLMHCLELEDQENGTQYFETLITYLNCMCNSAVAAKLLSIHRNTLLYRIKHIEEYYNCDLNDSHTLRNLALSAMVYTYSEQKMACEKSQT